MRTTLAIDDGLLATAKRRAHEKDCTLGQVVEASLRAYLSADIVHEATPELPVFKGKLGYQPGVNLDSPRALKDFLADEEIERMRAKGLL